MGKRVIMGRAWRLSKTPLAVKAPGPALGEHNREVIQDILGYTDGQYADLEQHGIIGTCPTKPRPPAWMEMDDRVKEGRLAYHDPEFKERLGIQDAEEGQSAPFTGEQRTRPPWEGWTPSAPRAYEAERAPARGSRAP